MVSGDGRMDMLRGRRGTTECSAAYRWRVFDNAVRLTNEPAVAAAIRSRCDGRRLCRRLDIVHRQGH